VWSTSQTFASAAELSEWLEADTSGEVTVDGASWWRIDNQASGDDYDYTDSVTYAQPFEYGTLLVQFVAGPEPIGPLHTVLAERVLPSLEWS
jgi:hypothetical protein